MGSGVTPRPQQRDLQKRSAIFWPPSVPVPIVLPVCICRWSGGKEKFCKVLGFGAALGKNRCRGWEGARSMRTQVVLFRGEARRVLPVLLMPNDTEVKMKRCAQCNSLMPDDEVRCIRCGAGGAAPPPIAKMKRCAQCNSRMPGDEVRCKRCGAGGGGKIAYPGAKECAPATAMPEMRSHPNGDGKRTRLAMYQVRRGTHQGASGPGSGSRGRYVAVRSQLP